MPVAGALLLRPAGPAASSRGCPVLRLLGVLLVVLGIVAMHQLAGGTHTATMSAGMSPGTHVSSMEVLTAGASPDRTIPDLIQRPSAGTGVPAAGSSLRPAAGRPDGPVLLTAAAGAAGAMPLCLAVLTGLLLITLPALTGRAPGARHAALRVAVHRSRPAGRGPPRDLLAQICVLRT